MRVVQAFFGDALRCSVKYGAYDTEHNLETRLNNTQTIIVVLAYLKNCVKLGPRSGWMRLVRSHRGHL